MRKVMEVRDANWSADAHIVQEAIEGREDADDISDICSHVPASSVMIYATLVGREGIRHVQVATRNQIIVAQEDASDRR
jgi:hypothetical protein